MTRGRVRVAVLKFERRPPPIPVPPPVAPSFGVRLTQIRTHIDRLSITHPRAAEWLLTWLELFLAKTEES